MKHTVFVIAGVLAISGCQVNIPDANITTQANTQVNQNTGPTPQFSQAPITIIETAATGTVSASPNIPAQPGTPTAPVNQATSSPANQATPAPVNQATPAPAAPLNGTLYNGLSFTLLVPANWTLQNGPDQGGDPSQVLKTLYGDQSGTSIGAQLHVFEDFNTALTLDQARDGEIAQLASGNPQYQPTLVNGSPAYYVYAQQNFSGNVTLAGGHWVTIYQGNLYVITLTMTGPTNANATALQAVLNQVEALLGTWRWK